MRLRDQFKKRVLGVKGLHRPSIAYCIGHDLLPEILVRTSAAKLRAMLFLPASPHETQLNQDIFGLLVNRFGSGFFLEIGANDGFTLSNTVYLEEQFNWTGIIVEANPYYSESLNKRKSKAVIAAVVEREGYYDFCNAGLYGGLAEHLDKTHEKKTRDASPIVVWGTTLERILESNSAPPEINFVSIDVEGAEASIVEQMCRLKMYRFVCGCIEHNGRHEDYMRIAHLLREARYRIVWDGQTRHDLFFIDESKLTACG